VENVAGIAARMLPAVEPVYDLARALLVPPLASGLRWTIEGSQRVPVRGPAIVASNHVSYLDPLVIGFVLHRRHRRARFLAKAELFDRRLLGPLLRAAGQIPVARGTREAAASLDAAVLALRRGECVAVFPEGTIPIDSGSSVAKTGTARLAAESGVAVLPMGLWGAQRLLAKGRRPRWRWGIAETVVVGDPVRIRPDEPIDTATARVMAAIAACVRRARELYPQRPAPGEDPWWTAGPVAQPEPLRT
jgi:1-acyl-sn-glycerol-3-phosphate acyltransferase